MCVSGQFSRPRHKFLETIVRRENGSILYAFLGVGYHTPSHAKNMNKNIFDA